jgi:hypothetical protein
LKGTAYTPSVKVPAKLGGLQFAEKLGLIAVQVLRRFSAASKSFIFCHHEPASAGEGSAFRVFQQTV